MKKIRLCSCLITAVALVGCSSSGSDSTPSAAAELQGTWVSTCFPDAEDNNSTRNDFVVSGNSFTQSAVFFLNNQTCDGTQSLNRNELGTFVVTGGETELTAGNAKHVDTIYSKGTVTASQGFLDFLAAGGTNLVDFMSSVGVTGDLNNLSLAEIGRTQADFYQIYRIDALAGGGTEVRLGSTSDSYDGTSAALRPIRLSTVTRFTKVQ